MHRILKHLAQVVVVIAVPIVLTMTLVRLLTFPWYPAWQYRRAAFPADPYGLPRQDRLRLAAATIGFLNVPGQTDVLTTLTLPDGSPAYNDRELEHMDDVKAVYNGLTVAAFGLLGAAVICGWAVFREDGAELLWRTLTHGAALTLFLLVALGAWMLVGFDRFFTLFHGIFFQPGTWIFYYTDTLIRLFPIEFWQTAGLLVAGGVTVLALALLVIGSRQRA